MNFEEIKDFINRLRTNNIILISFSILVFLTLENTNENKIKRAISNLEFLVKSDFIAKEDFWFKSLSDSLSIKDKYKLSPLFDGYKNNYNTSTIRGYITTFDSNNIFTRYITSPQFRPPILSLRRMGLNQIETIRDLKNSWNTINDDVDIFEVDSIYNKKMLFRYKRRSIERFNKERKIISITNGSIYNFDNNTILSSPTTELTFIDKDSILSIIDSTVDELRIEKTPNFNINLIEFKEIIKSSDTIIYKRKSFSLFYHSLDQNYDYYLIPVITFTSKRINPQRELINLNNKNWKKGRFSESFPFLNEYFEELESLSVKQGKSFLNKLEKEVGEVIEFASFRIRAKIMSQYGVIIILILQLYCLLNLMQFSQKKIKKKLLTKIHWMGLYKNTFSILFWTSINILPTLIICWSIYNNLFFMSVISKIVNFSVLIFSLITFLVTMNYYKKLRNIQ